MIEGADEEEEEEEEENTGCKTPLGVGGRSWE